MHIALSRREPALGESRKCFPLYKGRNSGDGEKESVWTGKKLDLGHVGMAKQEGAYISSK